MDYEFSTDILEVMKKPPNKDGRSYEDDAVHGLVADNHELKNKLSKAKQDYSITRYLLRERTKQRDELEKENALVICSDSHENKVLCKKIRRLKKELENAKGTTTNSDTPSTTTDS